MDAQILLNQAKLASDKFSSNQTEKLAFHVGYLEMTVKELCDVLKDSDHIMHLQRKLIDDIKKGYSADL